MSTQLQPIKYSGDAAKIMKLANQEAIRLCNTYLGPEHIFLALSTPGEGTLYNEFVRRGYDIEKIRRVITDYAIQSGSQVTSGRGSPLPKKVQEVIDALNLARSCAKQRGDEEITPKHLLYGLISEKRSKVRLLNYKIPVDDLESHLLPPP